MLERCVIDKYEFKKNPATDDIVSVCFCSMYRGAVPVFCYDDYGPERYFGDVRSGYDHFSEGMALVKLYRGMVGGTAV